MQHYVYLFYHISISIYTYIYKWKKLDMWAPVLSPKKFPSQKSSKKSQEKTHGRLALSLGFHFGTFTRGASRAKCGDRRSLNPKERPEDYMGSLASDVRNDEKLHF